MTRRPERCYQCPRTAVLVPVRVFGLGLRRTCEPCADRLTADGTLERVTEADPRRRRQEVPDGLERRFRPRWLRRAGAKDLSGTGR